MKTSKYTKELLEPIVARCVTLTQVIIELGLNPSAGGTNSYISKMIKRLDIKWPHYLGSRSQPKRQNKIPSTQILVFNRRDGLRENLQSLKRAILEQGVPFHCATPTCKVSNSWLGKPITLHVDHIDGNPVNNLIGNLQFLCPNCHTQTETYGSKNKRIFLPLTYLSEVPKVSPLNRSQPKKEPSPKSTKIEWPENEYLAKVVWEEPIQKIAARLGVSDNAVLKRCKRNSISTPQRGYWAKQKSLRDRISS